MAWVAVDSDGDECVYEEKPIRGSMFWRVSINLKTDHLRNYILLPKGTIKKLIGREMTWNDEPIELK